MSSITEVPPATLPILDLIERYADVSNNDFSFDRRYVYTRVINDLEKLLKELKEK